VHRGPDYFWNGKTFAFCSEIKRNKSNCCESDIDVAGYRNGQMLLGQMIFTEWQKQSSGILL
jgi:hypothetical protein